MSFFEKNHPPKIIEDRPQNNSIVTMKSKVVFQAHEIILAMFNCMSIIMLGQKFNCYKDDFRSESKCRKLFISIQ